MGGLFLLVVSSFFACVSCHCLKTMSASIAYGSRYWELTLEDLLITDIRSVAS